MLLYPVELIPDENTIMAVVPDLPGCRTFGDRETDALVQAVQAARAAVASHMMDEEDIPLPSAPAGRPTIRLPLIDELKVRLYRAMRERSIDVRDLARRLGKGEAEAARLIDLTHASRIEQLEAAFAVLGYQVDAEVRAVA